MQSKIEDICSDDMQCNDSDLKKDNNLEESYLFSMVSG